MWELPPLDPEPAVQDCRVLSNVLFYRAGDPEQKDTDAAAIIRLQARSQFTRF